MRSPPSLHSIQPRAGLDDEPRRGQAPKGAPVVTAPQRDHFEAGGAAPAPDLGQRPQARTEAGSGQRCAGAVGLDAALADAAGPAAPLLAHPQLADAAAAEALGHQPFRPARQLAAGWREPGRIENQAPSRRQVRGRGAQGAVPLAVQQEVGERIVHRYDQVEPCGEAQPTHIGDEQLDVLDARQALPGDGDHLRGEIEGKDSGGGTGEKDGRPPGAGSQLEHPAAGWLARRPLPEAGVAANGELEVEVGRDAPVVAADLARTVPLGLALALLSKVAPRLALVLLSSPAPQLALGLQARPAPRLPLAPGSWSALELAAHWQKHTLSDRRRPVAGVRRPAAGARRAAPPPSFPASWYNPAARGASIAREA